MSKTSPWFNYTTYMANKLAQLQETDPSFGWNYTKLAQAFADAGYGDEAGAERHFMEHGQNEDIAPNAFFNPDEYYYFKAAEFYGVEAKNVTELQAGNMRAAIKGAGMNAWEHYKAYGTGEGVNPSNSFDSKAYIQAKTDALNVAGGDTKWTPEMVEEAFKNAGMSALEHFMVYGGKGGNEVANGLTADGKIPAEFKVDEANKVSVANGETKSLTTEIDTFVGTVHNDVYNASVTTGESTLNMGDSVDGGDGTDTLKVSAGTDVSFLGTTIKNVEIIDITAGANNITSIDVAGVTELEHLKLDVAAITDAAFTVAGINADDLLTLKGLKESATIEYNSGSVAGTNDSASIVLDGAAAAAKTITAADVENLTLQTTGGKSALGTLDVADLKTLTIAAGTDLSIASLEGGTTISLETLTVNGVGAVDITASQTAANALKTVTAGDGDLTLDLKNQNANSTLTFTGGKGDDTLKMKLEYVTAADKLSGGAEGRDTLVIADGGDLNAAESYAGINAATDFEVLGFGTAATVTMSNITTKFDTYEVYGASTGYSATFSDIATNTKFEVDFTGATTDDAFGTMTLSAKDILSTVDLTLDNNLNATATVANVTGFTNISFFNLHSEGGASANNKVGLTLADNMKVSVDGEASVSITTTLATGKVEVDASGLTGKAVLNYTAGSGNETVTGSANNDTFTKGASSGLDTFHGGKGADIYNMSGCVSANATLTLTFDDGDSVGAGGSMKLADMLKLAATAQTWDAVTSMVNSATGASAGHLTIDTKVSADGVKTVADTDAFETAGGFGKAAVDKAGDFMVVVDTGSSSAVIFQDTNSNGVIDSNDFMIKVTGSAANWADADFTVAGGNLTVTDAATS